MEVSQISITVGFNPAGAAALRQLADTLDRTGDGHTVSKRMPDELAEKQAAQLAAVNAATAAAPTEKKRPGRPAKTAAPATVAAPPENVGDFGSEEPTDSDFGAGAEDEAPEPPTEEAVMSACQNLAKRRGKEAAYKVLERFGVKRVRDLQVGQRQLVLDAANKG